LSRTGYRRLDLILVEKGYFDSRSRARAAIMEGKVLVNGLKVDKPGTRFPGSVKIQIIGEDLPYVSRGGLKLEKAIKEFKISFANKVVLDIGASTGGFTDCALQNGALKVFAVDVGYGQLAWKLRKDPRVINIERTNARYLTLEDTGEKVHIVTIDVSFISLEKILPVAYNLLFDGGELVALIKPQFEAGRESVGKKGVVKDPGVHISVIKRVVGRAEIIGYCIKGLTYSPIKGPEGNIEYLTYMKKESEESSALEVERVIKEAWENL